MNEILVDIEKIRMDGRIRKDFGDIEELAKDIERNGLINPPVCIPEEDGTFTLLAGERRIRAMKYLGYPQVEIRSWKMLSDADKLEVEISENIYRKNFVGHELAEAFERRLKYNQNSVSMDTETSPFKQTLNDLHVHHRTLSQTREILAHEAELDPELIKDWDDGKLSTAKLYREMKEQLAAQNEELTTLRATQNYDAIRAAREERDLAKAELEQAKADKSVLVARNRELTVEAVKAREGLIKAQREVTNPEIEAKISAARIAADNAQGETERVKKQYSLLIERYGEKINALQKENEKYRTELEQTARPVSTEISKDVLFFADRCADFLKKVGGYGYLASQMNELSDEEKANIRNGAMSVFAWAQSTLEAMEGIRDE